MGRKTNPELVAANLVAKASKKVEDGNKVRKRKFHELLRYIMEADLPMEDDVRQELEDLGFEQADYQTAMLFGQMKRAVYGTDTDAARFIRDTAGYKPTDSLQVGSLDDGLQVNLGGLSDEQLMQMIAEKTGT